MGVMNSFNNMWGKSRKPKLEKKVALKTQKEIDMKIKKNEKMILKVKSMLSKMDIENGVQIKNKEGTRLILENFIKARAKELKELEAQLKESKKKEEEKLKELEKKFKKDSIKLNKIRKKQEKRGPGNGFGKNTHKQRARKKSSKNKKQNM